MPIFYKQLYGEADHDLHIEKETKIIYASLPILRMMWVSLGALARVASGFWVWKPHFHAKTRALVGQNKTDMTATLAYKWRATLRSVKCYHTFALKN